MISKLKAHWYRLSSNFPEDPWIILPLIVASLAIIFDRWVPEYGFLVLVLLNVSMTFFNGKRTDGLWQLSALKVHPIVPKIITIAIGAGLYAVHLYVYHPAWLFSVHQLLILWSIYNGASYFTRNEGYVAQIVNAFRQSLIAGAYFALIYGIIFLITFFVNNIFDLNLFGNNFLYQTAFALSLFTAMLILFAIRPVEDIKGGPFFTTLFGKLIPKLSLVAGGLAIIYLAQMLFGFRPDMQFLHSYYPYIILFYTAFVLNFQANVEPKERKYLLGIFMALTVLTIAFIVKRQVTIPSQQISSIYSLIINGVFLAYNGYLLRKDVPVTATLSKVVLVMALVVFTPLVGFMSYKEFVTYTGPQKQLVAHYDLGKVLAKKDLRNNLERFQESRAFEAKQNGPNLGIGGGAPNRANIYYDSSQQPLQIAVDGQAQFYLRERLANGKENTYGNLTVKISEDGRQLELFEGNEVLLTMPIYEKAADVQWNKKTNEPFVFEHDKVKVYVVHYTYYADRNVQTEVIYHLVVKQ